jgi:hypothetical protein
MGAQREHPSRGAARRGQRNIEIGLREQVTDALRPLDHAYALGAETLGKSGCFPFRWIGEPIKIKVIEV